MRIHFVLIASSLFLACSGDDSYEPPTVPPATPTPLPLASSAYSVGLYTENGLGVEEVKVLLDGVVICTGNLAGPWDVGTCNLGDLGNVVAGRHRLVIEIIRQGVSPTRYRVSNRVEVFLVVDREIVGSQRFDWDESVKLATGQAWTGVFEVREWAD